MLYQQKLLGKCWRIYCRRLMTGYLTSEDAKPVLIDLISSIIKRHVVGVEVRNSEVPPADAHEKAERLDVNCRIDVGSQVDLEMQASRIEEESDGTSSVARSLARQLKLILA